MVLFPDRIESPQEIHLFSITREGEDKIDYMCFSGYAVFNFKGQPPSNSWHCIDLKIPQIGPRWHVLPAHNVCASVALASISNLGPAENAGWAVDNCKVEKEGGRISLTSRICVRDSDGFMQRVVYHINAAGIL